MKNQLLETLEKGKAVLGLNNMYPAPGIIEGMCKGWDFVWIDGQHGQHTQDSLLQSVRAADFMGVSSLVRVPGQSPDFLGLVADMNPSGIIVPMVNSEAEAKAVSRALHFAPLGGRSYGGRRVIDLGGREYFQDPGLMVLAQIETLEATKAVEAIADTEGIDCLFFGPDDMKLQLGLPVSTAIDQSKELQEAMRKVSDAARKAGKYAACPATTDEALKTAYGLGYRILALGGDIGFLRTGAQAKLTGARAILEKL
jgi:2-keto-3-deoxy-L-rhamnonate aldolase RhmA